MGAAASLVERAWRVRRGRDDLLVLTRAEVAEDEACLAAQRAAIRYCREHIYYGAPVRVSAVRSAAHHLPTALVSLDSARAAPGAAQDGARGGAAAVAGYPEACVVSPAGDIVVARRGGAPGRRVIRAATLAAATDPPAPPVLRPAAGGGGGAALGVAWAAPGGADAAAVVDRYEVQHRGAAGGGGGGTSPVGWRALGAVEPQRGDAHEAWARGVAPGATVEFRARARNHRGWSQWSRAVTLRAAPAPPDAPGRPAAGNLRPDAVGLFWRAPRRDGGAPVTRYVLRARRTDPAGAWRVVYDGPRAARLVDGLAAGTRYEFSVSAANGAGASGPSPPALVRTPSAPRAADGDAGGAANAALLREGDHWREYWDAGRERVFYFHRATGERRDDAPPEFAAAADAQEREARFRARRRALRDAIRDVPERGAEPLRVRRDRLVADSLAALLRAQASALRRRLRVEFVGEAGVDAGGLARDWCLALSRALADPGAGLFARTARGELELVAAPAGAADAKRADAFRAVGRLVAAAVAAQLCLDLPLAPPVLDALRGVGDDGEGGADDAALAAALADVDAVDAPFARSLRWILGADLGADGGALGERYFTATAPGGAEVELRAGGARERVHDGNKRTYALLVARWRARGACAMELDALLRGAAEAGLAPGALAAFSGGEVRTLICGRGGGVDVDELRAHAQYTEDARTGFGHDHVVALWFWQAMADLGAAGVARVLAFATGSDRIPVDGFRPPLTLTHDAARADALPVAHTCFNQIILSRASSYAAAARQLRCAVDNCASFELS